METIITKICTSCGKTKPLTDFPKEKRNKSGYRADCKVCRREYNKGYFSENRGRLIGYMKGYYESNKESAIAKAKEWYENNREKHRESSRAYKKNHPDMVRESSKRAAVKRKEINKKYKRQWIEKNPCKGRQYNQKRKAKLLGVGGEITAEEWEALLDFYGRKCLCCNKTEEEVPIHLDHVVPVSKNGKNVIGNAQPLCKSCNSAKHDKIIDYRINFNNGI